MYNPERRKDCPMRGKLGNCGPIGGFCYDAVSDELCEAAHNAYDHGWSDALMRAKYPADSQPASENAAEWDRFHSLPFELRQAVRSFWKIGNKYVDDSDVWDNLPDNIPDEKQFRKAVQMYDTLLRRNAKF